MKHSQYLSNSYWDCEKDQWVRDCIIKAFDAVGDHVASLEAKVDRLEKASKRSGDRAR